MKKLFLFISFLVVLFFFAINKFYFLNTFKQDHKYFKYGEISSINHKNNAIIYFSGSSLGKRYKFISNGKYYYSGLY